MASISELTSIWETPRGAGGILVRSNFADDVVVLGKDAFAVKELDGDGGLLVGGGGGEHLRLLGRDAIERNV